MLHPDRKKSLELKPAAHEIGNSTSISSQDLLFGLVRRFCHAFETCPAVGFGLGCSKTQIRSRFMMELNWDLSRCTLLKPLMRCGSADATRRVGPGGSLLFLLIWTYQNSNLEEEARTWEHGPKSFHRSVLNEGWKDSLKTPLVNALRYPISKMLWSIRPSTAPGPSFYWILGCGGIRLDANIDHPAWSVHDRDFRHRPLSNHGT
jgi:hypothetical protein